MDQNAIANDIAQQAASARPGDIVEVRLVFPVPIGWLGDALKWAVWQAMNASGLNLDGGWVEYADDNTLSLAWRA